MTDAANTLYAQEIAGNLSLPKTKAGWPKQVVELRQKLQLLDLGGVGPTNVRMVYGCAGDAEIVTDIRRTVGESPVADQALVGAFYSIGEQFAFRPRGKENISRMLSDPESPEMARQSAPRASAPIIGTNRVLNAQESLGALVRETLVGEATKLHLSSIAPSNQTVYLRGWKFRSRYCDSRGVSPRIEMSLPQWGVDLLHYRTW